jgi:transposase
VVHSAGLQDLAGAELLFKDMPRLLWARLQKIWADGAYRGALADWLEKTYHTDLEIVLRSDTAQGFEVLPRRWVVEMV